MNSHNGHRSLEPSARLGRLDPVHIVTIFAFAVDSEHDKRYLPDYEDLLVVHDLDLNLDLIEQWDRLSLPQGGPDLILAKLHQVIGAADVDPTAAIMLSNYDALRRRHWETFNRLQLISLEKEIVLANRFSMQDLIDKVCHSVNMTLGCGQSQPDFDHDSHIRSEIARKLNANLAKSAASLGGGDRRRSKCRKPPSLQVECPRESFTTGYAVLSSKKNRPTKRPKNLPLFPLIVKPRSTAVKSMALVVDEEALRHFSEGPGKGGVVIEQFVQHDNVILKIYVIGKEVWVVRRPSLPNVKSFSKESLVKFASEIDGSFVPCAKSPAGGYATFLSDKMTKSFLSSKLLEDCDDLDGPVFRLLTSALTRELEVDLFGFDALVESQTKNVFVVDVNFLPGYKGVPSPHRRMCEWLAFLSSRRAFKIDCQGLRPDDLLSLIHPSTEDGANSDDESKSVRQESLAVKPVKSKSLFEVTFKNISYDSTTESAVIQSHHVLLKLFPVPRRLVKDEDLFPQNLAVSLAAKGSAPAFVKGVEGVYFGKQLHLGMVREWAYGQTLHNMVVNAASEGLFPRSRALFSHLGEALARFHLLANDADFRRDIIERHFVDAAPIALTRLEEWRRGALLSLFGSSLKESPLWGDLYRRVIEAGSKVVGTVGSIIAKMKTNQALRPVFGHNDCSPAKILIRGFESETEEEEEEQISRGIGTFRGLLLIDDEWAAPNLAVYDFANFIMAMTMLRIRGLTKVSETDLRSAVGIMASAYSRTMKTELRCEEDFSATESFIDDIWAFVPLCALTHCFSNLIHASKERQLTTSVPVERELYSKCGTFNWLWHASNHLALYNRFVKSEIFI